MQRAGLGAPLDEIRLARSPLSFCRRVGDPVVEIHALAPWAVPRVRVAPQHTCLRQHSKLTSLHAFALVLPRVERHVLAVHALVLPGLEDGAMRLGDLHCWQREEVRLDEAQMVEGIVRVRKPKGGREQRSHSRTSAPQLVVLEWLHRRQRHSGVILSVLEEEREDVAFRQRSYGCDARHVAPQKREAPRTADTEWQAGDTEWHEATLSGSRH